jgi:hypothetical protein
MPKKQPGAVKVKITGSDKTQPTGTTSKLHKDKYNRLTDEQINLIKVYEIDLTSTREPRIVIPRDVISEFLEEYSDKDKSLRGRKSQQAFRRASGAKQLRKMFQLRAREFYGRAEVREDPQAIEFFKRAVHRTYVLNYCGTTRCHGGPDAGEFKLIPFRQTSDLTVYTNFFLLNQWKRGEGYMLDRDKVEQSYLIQYGLPRKNAKFPHPGNIKGWKPNLIGRSNTTNRNLRDWVGQLYRPAPKYPISFKLTTDKAGVESSQGDSQPASLPAKEPPPGETPSP